MRAVGHPDLGQGAPDLLRQPNPEMPCIGLGSGNRGPVVTDMLVLADHLAGVTAVTFFKIDHKDFFRHGYFPLSTHASNLRPEAGL